MVNETTGRDTRDFVGANHRPREGRELFRLLSVYNVYRLTLALGLLGLAMTHRWGGEPITGYHPGILWLAGIWLASAAVINRFVGGSAQWAENLALAVVLLDLVLVAFLVQLAAGLSGGLPLLFLVTVAAAAVLIPHRVTATGIAALATLAVLGGTALKFSSGTVNDGDWFYASLLGCLNFALSLFLQQLVMRLTSAEQLADTASSQIATLEELNQQIISHMTTGICRIAPDNSLIPLNDAAGALLGLSDTHLPQPLETVSPRLAAVVAGWRSGQRLPVEPITLESTGGQILPELVHLGHTLDPELMLFVDDYTAVSEAAQALKLRSLGKLTASIAHEIRNPLAAISHAVQLMAEPAADAGEAATLREIVLNNTHRVNDIIDNILQLSRPQTSGQEGVDLATWLPNFVKEYEGTRNGDVRVFLALADSPLSIQFDTGNLRRVLVNLLDNGTEHAERETGRAVATIAVTRDYRGNAVCVDVIDSGKGVQENQVEHLFEPFFTTRPEGTGLGLYLSRELCEANRATLSYGRTVEGCTRFRMNIPLREPLS